MMSRTVKLAALLPVAGLVLAAVSLPAHAAKDRNIGGAVVRDHRSTPEPTIRDHRSNQPVVRDHRSGGKVVQTGPSSFKLVRPTWSPYKPSR
ncbi:MAG: hypothetical protein ABL904_25040 [Hyphomicrobiaceae bacterium]